MTVCCQGTNKTSRNIRISRIIYQICRSSYLLFNYFSSQLRLYKTDDVKIYWGIWTQRITSCFDVVTDMTSASEPLQLCVSVYWRVHVSFHFITTQKQRNNGLLLKANKTNVAHLVLVDDHRPHSWLERSAASGVALADVQVISWWLWVNRDIEGRVAFHVQQQLVNVTTHRFVSVSKEWAGSKRRETKQLFPFMGELEENVSTTLVFMHYILSQKKLSLV